MCRVGVRAVSGALLLAGSSLYAQSNGDSTLTGTVVDVSGKPIAGAVVSVKNESSGPRALSLRIRKGQILPFPDASVSVTIAFGYAPGR